MENSSKLPRVNKRDLFYYRQRSKNRLLETLSAFFEEEAGKQGITKRDVGYAIDRDPASITRWLTAPSNLTVETISDLLLSVGAEMDYVIAKFDHRPSANEMHPLIARLMVTQPQVEFKRPPAPKPYQKATPTVDSADMIAEVQ